MARKKGTTTKTIKVLEDAQKEAIEMKYNSMRRLKKPNKPKLPKKPKTSDSLTTKENYLKKLDAINELYAFEMETYAKVMKKKAEIDGKVNTAYLKSKY